MLTLRFASGRLVLAETVGSRTACQALVRWRGKALMKRLVIALALAMSSPAVAEQPGGTVDPVAFARDIYRLATGTSRDVAANDPGGFSRMPIFSPRLRALFAADGGGRAHRPAGGAEGKRVTL